VDEHAVAIGYFGQAEQLLPTVNGVDLHHFKHLKDRFGHAMGGTVLRDCGQLCAQAHAPQKKRRQCLFYGSI
jgi:GGDEF domain-containing protein